MLLEILKYLDLLGLFQAAYLKFLTFLIRNFCCVGSAVSTSDGAIAGRVKALVVRTSKGDSVD